MREHTKEWIGRGARERGFGFPPGGGQFGGPFGGWGGGRGHRHHGRGRGRPGGRRPNVRAAVLALLVERPMHGYEMIQELDTRTGGIWRPSPGSIYPTLQLLEDEGLIVADESGARRRFTLTEAGRAEAQQAAESAPWNDFGDENVSQAQEYRDAIFGIMNALRQVGFNGTDEQRARALEVLTETRRRLYAILADEA
jgi:DNA-binding PadR family transcriptional regulator